METEKPPTNPMAFPVIDPHGGYGQLGMDLRDYFAGSAINSLATRFIDKFEIHRVDILASEAYRLADAMLIEREKYHEEIAKRNQNINL